MADLRSALTSAGLTNVATYIQSGNIAAEWASGDDALAQLVEEVLVESFDVEVRAIVVAQAKIASVLDGSPFAVDANPAYQVIYFANAPVDVNEVNAIDPSKYPGDTITASPTVVYVSYEHGQSKSKLTLNALERAAGCDLTGRNLRSTTKLLNL